MTAEAESGADEFALWESPGIKTPAPPESADAWGPEPAEDESVKEAKDLAGWGEKGDPVFTAA